LRRTRVALLLGILVLSSLVPLVVIEPVFAWTGSVYIRADGTVDPPSSPLQRNGTLYTLTGNISSDYEAIVIEKGGLLLDGAGFTVQGLGSINSVGVEVDACINVTVQRMRIIGFGYDMVVNRSSIVDVSGNVVTGGLVGVLFEASSYNELRNNEITDNVDGIELHASLNNSIRDNFVGWNSRSGISLCSSQNNSIVHNSLTANSRPVDTCPDLLNVWNEGYPSGGNWWSGSHNGTDVYKGPFQNTTGSDGIGDSQYIIDNINFDRYPLMGPWTNVGQNVTVVYSPEVSLAYGNVVSVGVTIFNLAHTGNVAPLSFLIVGQPPTYYDVKTTANYSGPIDITLPYSDFGLSSFAEKSLALVQWNGTSEKWENITLGVDTIHNLIFGETSYLSVFTIIVPLLGDIKKDGVVDIFDAILLSTAFNSHPGSPTWNPQADINQDDIVDIYDAIILSTNFGKK
jgi:parallel beta-helix repeat protein